MWARLNVLSDSQETIAFGNKGRVGSDRRDAIGKCILKLHLPNNVL
jgi:hypothetical protein